MWNLALVVVTHSGVEHYFAVARSTKKVMRLVYDVVQERRGSGGETREQSGSPDADAVLAWSSLSVYAWSFGKACQNAGAKLPAVAVVALALAACALAWLRADWVSLAGGLAVVLVVIGARTWVSRWPSTPRPSPIASTRRAGWSPRTPVALGRALAPPRSPTPTPAATAPASLSPLLGPWSDTRGDLRRFRSDAKPFNLRRLRSWRGKDRLADVAAPTRPAPHTR